MPVNVRQQQQLHDIWVATHTPQWVLEAEAQEEGWITDDQHAANAWWDSQSDEIPF
jgi:hypothetical protein